MQNLKIRLPFAIVHSEYLYNPNTLEFRVVESALRGGGVYISSHLIPLYTGIDINSILLDCVIGKPVEMESVMKSIVNRAAGYICFYLPDGEVISINGVEECSQLPFVKMAEIKDIFVGMVSPVLTHKGQRLGPILIDGADRSELSANIEKVQSTIGIEVMAPDGIVRGIKWD